MHRFYWLLPGKLAGCSRPGGRNGHELDSDLLWLKTEGVGALLSLTETPLPTEALRRHDFESLHLPVPDMTPPLPEQLHQALDFIDWEIASGKPVAVHCLEGQGRTGTVLAAHLIRTNTPATAAIQQLRVCCPGAIENPSQEAALRRFEVRQDWIV